MKCSACKEMIVENRSFAVHNMVLCEDCAKDICEQVMKRKKKRTAIPDKIKKEVLLRDGYYCRYCGKAVNNDSMVYDHIVPVSRGGLTTIDNLVVSCRTCNGIKGASLVEELGWRLLHPRRHGLGAKLCGHLEKRESKRNGTYWRVVVEAGRGQNNKRRRLIRNFYGSKRDAYRLLKYLLEKGEGVL